MREHSRGDKAVDLVDEGIELIAGCGGLPAVELGDDGIELGDQPGALAGAQDASVDQVLVRSLELGACVLSDQHRGAFVGARHTNGQTNAKLIRLLESKVGDGSSFIVGVCLRQDVLSLTAQGPGGWGRTARPA